MAQAKFRCPDPNAHNFCVPSDPQPATCCISCNPNEICSKDAGTLQEELRLELIEQLKNWSYYERLINILDKSTYRMKRDELLTRMQVENNEKQFQDCLCSQERDKQKRQEEICRELQCAAAELEKRNEEIREDAFKKQLNACAPEIRELERQIRRAYYGKTLHAQRLEADCHKLEDKVRDMAHYDMMMQQLQLKDEEELEKKQEQVKQRRGYLSELKNQIGDGSSKMAARAAELERDKVMVDQILALIKEEEITDLMEKVEKVQLYRSEIDHFLAARDANRESAKKLEASEECRRLKYLEQKAADEAEFKKAKEAQAAVKAAIVAKAIERKMNEQFKNEEIEELRQELMEEEVKADLRRRELEDLDRKQKQMMELRAAAEEAMRLRDERIAAEKQEEEEYRKQLMEKFAEDVKLEQFGYQKRRQREREHRLQVEKMIQERRCLRAQEKEKDQHVLDCFNQETERRQAIIDKERIALLKKHGPQIIGFIPRGVIKSQKELEALGEPFLSYYRCQPLEPDPTTVDSEPCEEEIFKTMELPRHVKY